MFVVGKTRPPPWGPWGHGACGARGARYGRSCTVVAMRNGTQRLVVTVGTVGDRGGPGEGGDRGNSVIFNGDLMVIFNGDF